MTLDDLLVCPVCHSELPLSAMRKSGRGSCSHCGRTYTYRHGVFDFTPVPPPDAEVHQKWSLWQKLQRNGLISYTSAPELNLSVGQREDAKAFSVFSQLFGLVLDVGCGPQDIPSYGVKFPGQLVGIDPLRGVQPRRFNFVQGIGEYLPFRAATFDRILFGTSLDHMLSPRRALAEVRRVMRSEGTVNIWFDEVGEQCSEAAGARWSRRARKAISMLRQGDVAGVMRLFSVRARLWRIWMRPRPDGALDHFHFVHMNQSMVEAWLRDVGLTVTEVSEFNGTNSRFVRATPADEVNPA